MSGLGQHGYNVKNPLVPDGPASKRATPPLPNSTPFSSEKSFLALDSNRVEPLIDKCSLTPSPAVPMQSRFASSAVNQLHVELPPQVRRRAHNKKAPLVRVGAFYYKVPGSDLLSHANAHYHRRDFVSRPCSGWEGVGPKRYGRQA